MNHFFKNLSYTVSINPFKSVKSLFLIGALTISFNSFSQTNLSQTNLPLSDDNSGAIEKVSEPQVDTSISSDAWLLKLKTALTTSNFQAGIVAMKAGKTTSFIWLHGVVTRDDGITGDKAVEVESISPSMGTGVSNVRQGNLVTFIEPNKEAYSITSDSIRKFIPPIFYQDATELSSNYKFVMETESQIGGRSAQLMRIESIDNTTYDYWVWIDVQSSLPLRMAFINQKNELVEQVVMTQLSVFSEPNDDIINLSEHTLPAPVELVTTTNQETNNWNMSWLPNSFTLIKSDRHHLSATGEVSDYYLYSDGLVEFSIYVQRQLDSFNSPLILQEGAMSFVMMRSDGFDVTVVGTIPADTAHKIARSIKSN